MKLAEVPSEAFTAAPTPVPTKVVPDWDSMYQILLKQGFVIIESNELRSNSAGGAECVPVKSFNNHVRLSKGVPLRTKRITGTKWFCCL